MLINDDSSTSDWHWLGRGIVRFAKYLMKLELLTEQITLRSLLKGRHRQDGFTV